jgi:acyl carrier protein
VYRSGDIGMWLDDGSLRCLGRRDGQVKVNGVRIEVGEIENALLGHPQVSEAAVVAQSNRAGGISLGAYVVAPGASAEDLLRHLEQHLPGTVLPHRISVMESLPRTNSGKIDRKALAALEDSAPQEPQEAAAPATETERLVAEVYGQVLGCRSVGRDDDFFALGGHSLQALMLLARMRKSFGVELAPRELFELRTVRRMAQVVDELRAAAQPAGGSDDTTPGPKAHIRPVQPQADYEASAAQRRMWLVHQLDPTSTAYHIPALLEVPEGVDGAALEQVLGEVLRRHEVLRTVFLEGEGGLPRQQVRAPWDVKLPVRHIDSEPQAQEHFLRFIREPFDFTQGPLFRAEVLRVPGQPLRLAWCMHEIISDGSSTLILEREVRELLHRQQSGEPALPVLPIQYKDFAAWQNSLVNDGASRQYWHEQLGTNLTRLLLPYDWPLTRETPAHAAQYQMAVTGPAYQALMELCRSEHVTVFMVLQATLAVWLARLTGQRDVVIAVPTSGRDVWEAEPLIGFFLNTVLLRMRVEPGQRFEQVLAHAKEVALNGLQHQHYPFEQLIEELQLPRPVNQFPVTPVLFNLLNFLERGPLGDVPPGHEPLQLDGKAELGLTAREYEDGLVLRCAYRTALFKPQTIEYLMQQWLAELQQVSATPAERIEALALFADEQARTLQSPYLQFASELLPEPAIEGVLALIARQTEQAPHAVAIEWQDRQCCYAQLEAHSNRIALQLQQLGCARGDVVALLLHDPMEHIAAVLGVMKAGAVFMTLDGEDPPARLQALAQRVQPRWWVAEGATAEVLPSLAPQGHGVWLGETEVPGLTALTVAPEPVTAPADVDACYLYFTSGSTGQPKPILGRSWAAPRPWHLRPAARLPREPTYRADLRCVAARCVRAAVCGRHGVRAAAAQERS